MKQKEISNGIDNPIRESFTKDQIEIIQYGFHVVLNTLIIVLCLLITGFLTHRFLEMVTFMVTFATLRQVAGGFHMATLKRCTVVTTSLGILTTWLGIFLTSNSNRYVIMSLLVVALVLIYLFANKGDKQRQNDLTIDCKYLLKRKQTFKTTLLLVIIIWGGSTIDSFAVYVNVAVVSIVVVALCLVKYKSCYLFNPFRF